MKNIKLKCYKNFYKNWYIITKEIDWNHLKNIILYIINKWK